MARLVRSYQVLPFCLARLVDVDRSFDEKQVIANWFMKRSRCCLDAAFSRGLRDRARTEDDLLPGGSLYGVLELAFTGKNTNVETENNFARAQKAQRTGQGRSVLSTSMAAKHVLSEAKRYHLLDVESRLPELRQQASEQDAQGPRRVIVRSQLVVGDVVLFLESESVSLLQGSRDKHLILINDRPEDCDKLRFNFKFRIGL